MVETVKNYILSERSKKISDDVIVKKLLGVGWTQDQVNQAFSELNIQENKPQSQKPQQGQVSSPNKGASGQYDRENDAISSEEFTNLEKQEFEKLSPLKKLMTSRQDGEKSDKTVQKKEFLVEELSSMKQVSSEINKIKDKLDNLSIDIDKVKGKIEMEEDSFKGINERIQELSEQIGELRSTLLSRERFFDKMEIEFEQMKIDFSDMRPSKIQKEFEHKEESILQNAAKIDKQRMELDNVKKKLDSFETSVNKIKSFDSLVSVLEKIDVKIKSLQETERRVEVMVNKTETMFMEMKESVSKISANSANIDDAKSNISELIKDVDKINVKMQNVVKKPDLDKIDKDLFFIKNVLFEKESKILKKNQEEKVEGNIQKQKV